MIWEPGNLPGCFDWNEPLEEGESFFDFIKINDKTGFYLQG